MVLVMTPKEDYKEEIDEAERKKLSEMVAGLSIQDKEKVFKTGNYYEGRSKSNAVFYHIRLC